MWCCLFVSTVSLLQNERHVHRDRRSEKWSADEPEHALLQASPEGESRFCGFTSSGSLSNVGIDSAPIWRNYVETHRIQRSRGCDGRYLVWKCTEKETCGGLGDEIRGISAMLYLAMATERALLLDWRKDGVSYAGSIFGVKAVDWTMPENCAWSNNIIHVIDTPYDGLDNLVKKSAELPTEQENAAAKENMLTTGFTTTSLRGHPSYLAGETKAANRFGGAGSSMQVIEVVTNLQTPQQSPGIWKSALESLPALRELSKVATLSVGCAYQFLFEPTSALHETYERIRIPSTSFIGIHLRVGDVEMRRNPADMSRWKSGVSLLAECIASGLALLRSNEVAASTCEKPADDLAFFSDSQAVKDLSKTAGMLVTGVLPLHSEKDRMSEEQRVSTVAELLALADSKTLVTDTRRSGFANLALEIGTIRHGTDVESFGMRILPDVVELCKDRASGPFQTFGDSSPAALALDTRQKDDSCVVLRKRSGTESMEAQLEQDGMEDLTLF